MKKSLAICFATLCVLTACAPKAQTPAAEKIENLDQPNNPTTVIRHSNMDGLVIKVCDAGRAVYVFDGYKAGGITVVPDAPECKKAEISASVSPAQREY